MRGNVVTLFRRYPNSAFIDFTQSVSPTRAIPYDTGETYKFTRQSTVWCQAYDTGTQSLKWVEIPDNIPPMPGMRWDAVNSLWSPYDDSGALIPSEFRKGYWYLPQATNSIAYSRDFTGTGWTTSGGMTIEKNATGFDGVANSASTITDTDSTKASFITTSKTIENDSSTHCVLLLIGKDNDETRFPMVRAEVSGGTTGGVIDYKVNTKTGAVSQVSNSANGSFTVASFDDNFWLAQLYISNNSTGNTTLSTQLYPAGEDTFSSGGGDVSVTGSTVFDQAEIRLNTSFYDGSPIVTNGNAATRLAGNYQLSIANHNQAEGMALCEFGSIKGAYSVSRNDPLININGAGDTRNVLYLSDIGFKSYDGTVFMLANIPSLGADNIYYKVAISWSSDSIKRYLIVDGNIGDEKSYDGDFLSGGGSDISIGLRSLAPFYLKSLKYYQVDRGPDWIQGQQT